MACLGPGIKRFSGRVLGVMGKGFRFRVQRLQERVEANEEMAAKRVSCWELEFCDSG